MHSHGAFDPTVTASQSTDSHPTETHSSPDVGSRGSSIQNGLRNSTSQKSDSIPSQSARNTPDSSRLVKRLSTRLGSRKRQSGGFLLSSGLGSGGPSASKRVTHERDKGKGREQDARPTNDKTSPSSSTASRPHRFASSLDAARHDGPVGDEASSSTSYQANGSCASAADGTPPMANAPAASESPAFDPSQLVRMALSLSDGRRRYASAGAIPSPPRTTSRRVASTGEAGPGFISPAKRSNGDAVQDAIAHGSMRSPPTSGIRRVSMKADAIDASPTPPQGFDALDDVFFEEQFSTATLARAEMVRKYFELSTQYYRMLQYLPDIGHRNSDGTTRHDNSRDYNPLQYLRNKRLRTREKQVLQPPPAVFEDQSKVKDYVDEIARATIGASRRGTDVELPPLASSLDIEEEDGQVVEPPLRGHRRTDTATSRIQWVDSAWTFTPMDLFADTLWSENPENGQMLTDRHGHELLSHGFKSSPIAPTAVNESPRLFSPGRRSSTFKSQSIDEPDAPGKGHRKRHFLSIHRLEEDARKRLPWHRRTSSGSSGHSEVSDKGDRKLASSRGPGGQEENIGPLERHMQRMIEQEKIHESPEMISPSRWDPVVTDQETKNKIDSAASQGQRARSGSQRRPKPLDLKKSRSYSEGLGAHAAMQKPRGLLEDTDSGEPYSPAVASAMPMLGMNLSPTTSRVHSPTWANANGAQKGKQASSMDSGNIQIADFAAKDTSFSELQSTESLASQPKRSFESSRSAKSNRLDTILSNQGDADSIKDGKYAANGRTKEPGRGVSRLLKGGRIGEIVRGESGLFGDRSLRRDPSPSPTKKSSFYSVESESDPEADDNKATRVPTNASNPSQRRDGRPKYHLHLPSFRAVNTVNKQTAAGDLIDPISRQAQDRKLQKRFPGRGQVPALHIDVPDQQSDSDQESPSGSVPSSRNKNRGAFSPLKAIRPSKTNSYSALGPALSSSIGVAHTGLTNIPPSRDRDQNQNFATQRQRHWSIADPSMNKQMISTPQSQPSAVTARDIARVRALFLSSGIKAHALLSRADEIRSPPPKFLSLCTAARKQFPTPSHFSSVPRKAEFATAARLWSTSISLNLSTYEKAVNSFRDEIVPKHHDALSSLQEKANKSLSADVSDAAERADGFVQLLNTEQTLAVKQVNDLIDGILRNRRRRLRMVRRAGFKVLEWTVLSVMWFAWFVVVLVRIVRGILGGMVRSLKWIVWG